jgi:hypothetical protein
LPIESIYCLCPIGGLGASAVGRCGGSAEGRGEVITSYVEEAAVLSREIWKLIVREGAAVAVRLLAVALFLGTWGAGLPIGFLVVLAGAAGFGCWLLLGP